MKPFLIFIGGMITGALLMFLILFVISVSTERSKKEKLELINSILSDQYPSAEVQYVEVKLKNKYVELHTGMPKDSVQILVGKPDEVSLNTMLGSTYEHWGYKLRNKYVSDLDIEFVDGKLNEITQN